MVPINSPDICQFPNCIHNFLKEWHRTQVSSNLCSRNFFWRNGVIHTTMSRTTLRASWILKVFQPSWCQGRGFLENFWMEIHPLPQFQQQQKAPPAHSELPRQARRAIKRRSDFCQPPAEFSSWHSWWAQQSPAPGNLTEWPPVPSCADPSKQHFGSWVHSKDLTCSLTNTQLTRASDPLNSSLLKIQLFPK